MKGVDYSFSRPDIACLWNSGYRFVVRYVSSGSSGKNASKAEIDALIRKGFKVVIIHQDGATDLVRGYAEGKKDATIARDKAKALGQPADRPIFFALDTDPRGLSGSELAAVGDYLDGAASVIGRGRVGLYGAYAAIERYVPTKATFGWQTYAWSGGRISGKAHFRQYLNGQSKCGGQVDLNESYKSDFGQWPIASEPKGLFMHLTKAQEEKILAAANHVLGDGMTTRFRRLAQIVMSGRVNPQHPVKPTGGRAVAEAYNAVEGIDVTVDLDPEDVTAVADALVAEIRDAGIPQAVVDELKARL